MSSEAAVRRAIAGAERVLPGKPVAAPGAIDPRWQAIIRVGEWIDDRPEEVWAFALKWGKHAQSDLRDAVATVLLEHLLERHFDLIFPRLRQAVAESVRFADTCRRCWWMGQAERPENVAALERLLRRGRSGSRRPAGRRKGK